MAIVTNSFVPCNGKFPTITAMISMLFVVSAGFFSSIISALSLTAVIIFSIFMTLLASRILSATALKGVPSAYTLEMPPYRKPQAGKIIVRSILDRTIFVLGRSLSVAVPAGMVIYLMANITVDGSSILTICSDFLDPVASLIGLDGIILMGFILGFPANEIVIPIIIMGYLASGTLLQVPSISVMQELFLSNGWNFNTVICTIVFSLFHWPCSTTLLTVKKETKSAKWTVIAAILPTLFGIAICAFLTAVYKILN